jgi:hypothetical protein
VRQPIIQPWWEGSKCKCAAVECAAVKGNSISTVSQEDQADQGIPSRARKQTLAVAGRAAGGWVIQDDSSWADPRALLGKGQETLGRRSQKGWVGPRGRT